MLTVKMKELGLCLANLLPLNLGMAGITRKNWLSNHSLANLVRETSHAWSAYSEITGFLSQSMSDTNFFTLEMRRCLNNRSLEQRNMGERMKLLWLSVLQLY